MHTIKSKKIKGISLRCRFLLFLGKGIRLQNRKITHKPFWARLQDYIVSCSNEVTSSLADISLLSNINFLRFKEDFDAMSQMIFLLN